MLHCLSGLLAADILEANDAKGQDIACDRLYWHNSPQCDNGAADDDDEEEAGTAYDYGGRTRHGVGVYKPGKPVNLEHLSNCIGQ